MPSKAACPTTHPQILAGRCPWCGETIGEGSSDGVQWNIPRMIADLASEDETVRCNTVSSVYPRSSHAEEGLTVLRVALSDASAKIREDAESRLNLLGGQISPEEAEKFKEACRREPDDLALRILLLGFHFHPRTSLDERAAHIFWLIRNAPRCRTAGLPYARFDPASEAELYVEAKRLWLELVDEHKSDTSILGNAARFMASQHDRLSEELFRMAKALEPWNPKWPRDLGESYSRESRWCREGMPKEWAAKSLAEFELEQTLLSGEEARLDRLPSLAQAAFRAGDFAKARAYASEMVDKADRGDAGMAIFHGHQILGQVSLVEGDAELAKMHLLESCKTQGSPTLMSFGPTMDLARQIYATGERDAVVAYLGSCLVFWKMGTERLTRWIAEIKAGLTPSWDDAL